MVLSFLPAAESCRARRVQSSWRGLFHNMFTMECMKHFGVQVPTTEARRQAELLRNLRQPVLQDGGLSVGAARLLAWAAKDARACSPCRCGVGGVELA